MLTILILIIIIALALCFLSWRRIRNSKEAFTFIHPWAGVLGAFVWEDLFVFSLALAGNAVITLLSHDIRIGLLLLCAFWIVRSSGETLYFFLQQFHEPKHSPHEISRHFTFLKPLFGDICMQKHMIMMQVAWQTVITLSLSGIILLIMYWQHIPVWL